VAEEEHEFILITEAEAGERLDKILASRFHSIHSRSYFHTLIEQECILLNGLPVKKRIQPQAGDEVEIHFLLAPEINLSPEPIPLEILYEDEHLLAINKPAGMVVHPAVGHWTGTFVNALLHHCYIAHEDNSLRPGIVHRLDKETSGVLLAAKSSLCQQRLVALFAARQIHKEYLAICLGNPGNTTLNHPIGRHPIHRKLMGVVATGKAALTHCETLAFDGQISLVKVLLETGRTHQIRVHMKHHGTPVLGDSSYGNPSSNAKHGALRQLLHAHRLQFLHPMTGNRLSLVAPPPLDIGTWIKQLKYIGLF
jgi:23S rRNA pseudouridine1911/1915/1917 synthase